MPSCDMGRLREQIKKVTTLDLTLLLRTRVASSIQTIRRSLGRILLADHLEHFDDSLFVKALNRPEDACTVDRVEANRGRSLPQHVFHDAWFPKRLEPMPTENRHRLRFIERTPEPSLRDQRPPCRVPRRGARRESLLRCRDVTASLAAESRMTSRTPFGRYVECGQGGS